MSTVKVNNLQVGQSGTATHNFTLTAASADGTAKLARGIPGATTQDVMTVASDGKVDFPAGLSAFLGANQSLAANGYQKLPGGLILQWGWVQYLGSYGSTGQLFPYPTAFPNACLQIVGSDGGYGANTVGLFTESKTQFRAWGKVSGGAYNDTGIRYFAIGY